jgi:hypothetical protein
VAAACLAAWSVAAAASLFVFLFCPEMRHAPRE